MRDITGTCFDATSYHKRILAICKIGPQTLFAVRLVELVLTAPFMTTQDFVSIKVGNEMGDPV